MAKAVEEKKPLSLTEALGNRKKIGAPAVPAEPEAADPQAEEDAKFAELEARVAALEAKLAGEEAEEAPEA
jgi:hypothetical protein